MKRILLFERLESKALLGTLAVMVPTAIMPMWRAIDKLPPPEPEPDPGDLPTDNPPIIYPPLPPSGPVGPG
jgi:hypothetical protein